MANPEHLAKLKEGVRAWNSWRDEIPDIRPDLSEADLEQTDLKGIDLMVTNLERTAFELADLEGADFGSAGLSEAELSRADLRGADFRGASLRSAGLWRADLSRACLLGTDIGGVKLGNSVLSDVDLSETKGLETCRHYAPNIVDRSTLMKSGPLPLEFLRGCGLSDWEIEAAKLYSADLTPNQISEIQYRIFELRSARPLQLTPLFISYSHANTEFVDTLEPKLHDAGVLFWRDIHDMTAGRMDRIVERAVRDNPTLLVILSDESVKSDWVEYEVEQGRKLSSELGRDVLCPIALDDAWKTCDWPGPLRKADPELPHSGLQQVAGSGGARSDVQKAHQGAQAVLQAEGGDVGWVGLAMSAVW